MNKVKQNGNSLLISMLTVSPNQKYLIFTFDSVVLLAGPPPKKKKEKKIGNMSFNVVLHLPVLLFRTCYALHL